MRKLDCKSQLGCKHHAKDVVNNNKLWATYANCGPPWKLGSNYWLQKAGVHTPTSYNGQRKHQLGGWPQEGHQTTKTLHQSFPKYETIKRQCEIPHEYWRGAHLPFLGREPNRWSLRRQLARRRICGCLPSSRASLLLDRYQIMLLGEKHIWANNLTHTNV